ncbi:MAG TPA: hypothetical protein VMM18_13840 [Gemmatimonadaceae bacterium]|nr:hypothetical protein [Gemmatimonadaceae bacterium]
MAMIVALAIGIPLVRALARRWEREAVAPRMIPPELATRLERIEHAVESIAIEVERISEGQRFTTRLLSERNADAGRIAARPDLGR